MSTKKILTFLGALGVATLAILFIYESFSVNNNLDVKLERSSPYVSPNVSLHIDIIDSQTPIESVVVTTRQNEKTTVIEKQQFVEDKKTGRPKITLSLKKARLKNGAFKLSVVIKAAPTSFAWKGKTVEKSWDLIFDAQPPQIRIHSPAAYVHRGSSTAFAYSLSKPAVKTGVEVDGKLYPAFQQQSGVYYCFFPFPEHLSESTFTPSVIAEDAAGNLSRVVLPVQPIPRNFKSDSLFISDAFLEKAMPPFEQLVPDASNQLERYLTVNSVLRDEGHKKLVELSQETAPTILWSGKFCSLPRSVAKAGFGEDRTYIYKNQTIDKQVHLGLDLASVAQAPVPAANDGKVVFADNLGIYGNLVVIDHGLGVQTLYAHLSSIVVKKDQAVKKNDIIGYTGKTGLAGGDHLHFGITIGGVQVNPIDWLDSKWIKNTITNRITLPHKKKTK